MSCIKAIFSKKTKKSNCVMPKLEHEPNFKKCIICFNLITFTETITLDCEHMFHSDCIIEWLMRSLTCPICRCEVVLGIDYTNYKFCWILL